jgi:hypothetical protein
MRDCSCGYSMASRVTNRTRSFPSPSYPVVTWSPSTSRSPGSTSNPSCPWNRTEPAIALVGADADEMDIRLARP